MEPITAVGLVANALQLAEFTGKLISSSKDYYDSAEGQLVGQIELRAASERISLLVEHVLDDQTSLDSLAAQESFSVGREIQDISRQCCTCAQELQKVLDGLKLPGKHRGWNSVRQALRSVWNEDKIEKLSGRLAHAEQQLQVFLLVQLSIDNSAADVSIRSNLKGLQKVVLDNAAEYKAVLQEELQTLRSVISHTDQSQRGVQVDDWHKLNRLQLDGLSVRLSRATEEDRLSQMRSSFLDSLYFPRIEERHEQITQAHKDTFQWIFKDSQFDDSPDASFSKWLQEDLVKDNIYWISGKAGSGKSTLMRFIADHRETRNLLRHWFGQQRPLVAHCFFWKAGSSLQKSILGLMRSLLHQLLSQHDLFGEVAPECWRRIGFGGTCHDFWNEQALKTAFKKFIEGCSLSSRKIFVMIDGLDEFEGSEDEMSELVDLVLALRKHQHVKICVSSRPWNIFHDAFETSPKFLLHTLTYNDIESFIRDTLMSSPHFRNLYQFNPTSCASLIQETTSKAEGVFLWVVLVVRDFLRDLRNGLKGLSIESLHEHLNGIPGNLDEFFLSMLTAINTEDRMTASKIFQLMLKGKYIRGTDAESSNVICLLDLSFCDQEENYALEDLFAKQSLSGVIEFRNISMARRLNSLCMGLLMPRGLSFFDSPETSKYVKQWVWKVDYLHRSVKDFLEQDKPVRLLHTYTTGPFDTEMYYVNAYAAQLQLFDIIDQNQPSKRGRGDELVGLIECFLRLLQMLEVERNVCPLQIIQKVEPFILRQLKRPRAVTANTCLAKVARNFTAWQCSFSALAVLLALNVFLNTVLSDPDPQPRPDPSLLLAFVVGPLHDGWTDDSGHEISAQYLLSAGADPNKPNIGLLSGKSAWEALLTESKLGDKYLISCVKLFVKHGANRTITLGHRGPVDVVRFMRDQPNELHPFISLGKQDLADIEFLFAERSSMTTAESPSTFKKLLRRTRKSKPP